MNQYNSAISNSMSTGFRSGPWRDETAKRLKGIDRHVQDQLRIVSMLTKLGQRNQVLQENPHRDDHIDNNDNDNDNDAKSIRSDLFGS